MLPPHLSLNWSWFGVSKTDILCFYPKILPLGISLRKKKEKKPFHFCWIVPISFQKANNVKTCAEIYQHAPRNQWDIDLLFLTTFTLFFLAWCLLLLGYFKMTHYVSLPDPTTQPTGRHLSAAVTFKLEHRARKARALLCACGFNTEVWFPAWMWRGWGETSCWLCSRSWGAPVPSLGCLSSRRDCGRGLYSKSK